MNNVPALARMLDCRVLEVRKVLTGEGKHRRSTLALDRHKIGGGGLVTISWAPEVKVRDRAEMDSCFDRLMRGPVFAQTNGVVCG
jgi:hypothetical protein